MSTVTVTVTAAQAAALPHPSCRPLVVGLLAVLDDPGLGADPATTRHAWVELDLVAAVPVDVGLTVTATATTTARLGTGDGVWIDVDVAEPDGALIVRSRHVVAATLASRPEARGTIPRIAGVRGDPTAGFTITPDDLAAYRAAADDTSAAHAADDHAPIVPGLLALWSALRCASIGPAHVEARFVAPLPVGEGAEVVVDGSTLAVGADGTTILRAHTPATSRVRAPAYRWEGAVP